MVYPCPRQPVHGSCSKPGRASWLLSPIYEVVHFGEFFSWKQHKLFSDSLVEFDKHIFYIITQVVSYDKYPYLTKILKQSLNFVKRTFQNEQCHMDHEIKWCSPSRGQIMWIQLTVQGRRAVQGHPALARPDKRAFIVHTGYIETLHSRITRDWKST